jgi:hypothetical protein
MTLDEYKAKIDCRIRALQAIVRSDLEASYRGIACGARLNLSAYGLAVYSAVRAELDEIDWMQL